MPRGVARLTNDNGEILCIKCNSWLSEDAYYPSSIANRIWKCRVCLRNESRARRPKDPEAHRQRRNARARQRTARLAHDPLSDRRRLLYQAKSRAVAKGLPFDLTVNDIVIPTECPLLGIPLVPQRGTGTGPARNSPSLDRILPERGYVRGNVWVISHFANAIKRDASAEDLIKVGTALLEARQRRADLSE